MNKINIELPWYVSRERREDVIDTITRRDISLRMFLGVANGCTYYTMKDALDRAKRCPEYKHTIKQAFKLVEEKYKDYEKRLRTGITIQFFDPRELSDPSLFIDSITLDDMYSVWEATGGAGYAKIAKQREVLRHKILLSLEHHHVKRADDISFIILGGLTLEIAVEYYKMNIGDMNVGLSEVRDSLAKETYKDFSLEDVWLAYRRASNMLTKHYFDMYDLDEGESRNIQFGLNDYCKRFADKNWIEESFKQALQDYRELLRDNKTYRDAKKQINNIFKSA